MNELPWILAATFVVSSISFIGAVTLAVSEKLMKRILISLVGFSAGALMGGAFLHLLPETIEKMIETQPGAVTDIFLVVLASFVMFFVLEKLLWRHCHDRACPIHTFAYLNLFGDSVHNFIDGLIMAGSFMVSIPLGLITTLAVAAHEIPQELGDFGVLIYGGFKPGKALELNFVTALTAIAGGVLGYYFFPYLGGAMIYLLPFAAGGFLYIAASDLIPELHKEANTARTVVSFALFLVGIVLMLVIKLAFGG
jgi:zinc and cadmium transporter